MTKASPLSTVKAVIAALGGVVSVCELTGRSYQAVWNWGFRDELPSAVYPVITAELTKRRLAAEPRLFKGVVLPSAAPSSERAAS